MTSRVPYLVVTLGAVPAALNLVINALFGLALYGGDVRVPWTGPGSVGADLLIGTFLVAFLSARYAVDRAERDVRAGLVAGLPARRAWRLLPLGSGRRSLLLAFVVAVGGLLVFVPAGEALAPAGLVGWWVAPFKGVTSLVAGAVAIALAGARSLVGGPDHTAERAAALAAAGAASGPPLDHLDRACLAVTSREHGTSNAPTWHLRLAGDLPDARLRESLRLLAARYPSLRSRVQPLDGRPGFARRLRYVDAGEPPPLEVRDGPLAAVKHEVLNRHLDLHRDPALQVVAVREAGALHLLFKQHHALADGRAFIELLADWAALVRALERGDAAGAAEAAGPPVPRRPEVEALGLPPAALRRLARRGALRYLRDARRRARLRPLPFAPTERWHGDDTTVHVACDRAALEAWRPLREAHGVGVAAVLAAAYARAVRAWATARGAPPDRLRIEVIAETRPRDGGFTSFANHLASYRVETTPADDGPPDGPLWPSARAIQAALRAEHAAGAHLERLAFERWGASLAPLDHLRALLLDKAELHTHLSLSSLVALPIPELAGEGWRVEDVWVTTPTVPPHGLVLTVTVYGDRVTFNFNAKAPAMPLAEAREVAEAFAADLEALGPPLHPEIVVSGAPPGA